jgi:hypothetical protein
MDFRLYLTAYRGYNSRFYEYTLTIMQRVKMRGVVGWKVVCGRFACGRGEMRDADVKKSMHARLEISYLLIDAKCGAKLWVS